MFNVTNLSFSYGSDLILQDINFSVDKGQIYAIFGPNGCGKSTLIQCILKMLKPSRGVIELGGFNTADMSITEMAKNIAYIPQIHEKPFPFKVIDIVLMGRTAHVGFFNSPSDEDYDRAVSSLQRVGMLHYKDKPYTQLSGGETQLVLVARALVQDTPIIVMDEPTAHLDFSHELNFLEIISDLVLNEQITIIMATHFPNHAFYFENIGLNVKVAIMHNKEICVEGVPSKVLTEDNMERIFKINSLIISEQLANQQIRQIVPLSTLK